MNTIIVYSSKTGFTEKYATWLGNKLDAKVVKFDDVKKISVSEFNEAEAIIYGGWLMAGKVVNSEWFLSKISEWKGKKLALFAVGACPNEAPEIKEIMAHILNEEQAQYAQAFYCQGGMNYEKMKLPFKLAMKAFISMIQKKKDKTESEEKMLEMIDHSYDFSDEKYLNPIIEYIRR